jgi:hypothetical protein
LVLGLPGKFNELFQTTAFRPTVLLKLPVKSIDRVGECRCGALRTREVHGTDVLNQEVTFTVLIEKD